MVLTHFVQWNRKSLYGVWLDTFLFMPLKSQKPMTVAKSSCGDALSRVVCVVRARQVSMRWPAMTRVECVSFSLVRFCIALIISLAHLENSALRSFSKAVHVTITCCVKVFSVYCCCTAGCYYSKIDW